jgi:hypothetical protein
MPARSPIDVRRHHRPSSGAVVKAHTRRRPGYKIREILTGVTEPFGVAHAEALAAARAAARAARAAAQAAAQAEAQARARAVAVLATERARIARLDRPGGQKRPSARRR